MRKFVLAISVLACVGAAAHADPMKDREALMKSFGKSMGQLAPIAKGEKPFDATEAQAALATLHAETMKLDVAALFPEGSAGDSEASPKIWQNFADFTAKADKLKADAAAADAAKPGDLKAFQAAFGQVAQNCGGCHEMYRLKKN